MQDWRAVAKFGDCEALVVLGESQFQVVNSYRTAFAEVIDPSLRGECGGIVVQRWKVRAECGRWVNFSNLETPKCTTPTPS